MNNYKYYCPTRIIFGRGEEDNTGLYAAEYGAKKALLHYGGGSAVKSGLIGRIRASLEKSGVEYVELGGVKPNPRLSLVREGIELAKAEDVDMVIAVGGGSVIDSAKGIAAGVKLPGDIWDYYMDGSKEITACLPVAVVLTIPAAGSESSDGSVVTNEDTGFKRYIGSDMLRPVFSVLDPELTFTLPDYQTACGCSDILAHLMERYFSHTEHTDLTDRLLEGAMQTVMKFAPLAIARPDDYDVRAEIMQTGQLAHNGALSCGRLEDWASHDIEHELSGEYDIAHGAGLAIIFPAWMRYVNEAGQDRFVRFGRRVLGIDMADDEKEAAIAEVINRMESWYRSIGLPVRLSEVGINADRFDKMAKRCLVGRDHVGNFVQLHEADVKKIYEIAK